MPLSEKLLDQYLDEGTPSMLTKIPADELSIFWRGRAQALRMLPKPNDHADGLAAAYEECAAELSHALAKETKS